MVTKNPKKEPRLIVLRLGHRIPRDMRVTTHVCLTARALGASGVIVSNVQDRGLVERINRVTSEFGGDFTIETGRSWRQVLTDWRKSGGKIVHLTAYGIPLPRFIGRIRRARGDKLIVVGAEKVPGELFRLVDWNVAVTNQPISEVSALGIFLDWFFYHRLGGYGFANAKIRIIPTAKGKKVARC